MHLDDGAAQGHLFFLMTKKKKKTGFETNDVKFKKPKVTDKCMLCAVIKHTT